jgi:hypothetical protein
MALPIWKQQQLLEYKMFQWSSPRENELPVLSSM